MLNKFGFSNSTFYSELDPNTSFSKATRNIMSRLSTKEGPKNRAPTGAFKRRINDRRHVSNLKDISIFQ